MLRPIPRLAPVMRTTLFAAVGTVIGQFNGGNDETGEGDENETDGVMEMKKTSEAKKRQGNR